MFFYSLITLWNIRRILAEALCRNALLHVVKTFQSFIHQSCKILHYAVVDKVMYRSFFFFFCDKLERSNISKERGMKGTNQLQTR